MWNFRNDHREFDANLFKEKSKFNPNEDAAIEMCLSRFEEEILSLDEKISHSNLTKGRRNVSYLLRDDPSIVIKKAGKALTVEVWDREDYLREDNSQLSDKDVYREVKGIMDSLEEDILSNSFLNSLVWWRYVDDVFMMPEHKEEELQKLLEILNCNRPTTKFAAEYFRVTVTVMKKGNQLVAGL